MKKCALVSGQNWSLVFSLQKIRSLRNCELCSLPRTIRLTYGSEPLFSITYLSAHNPSTERCFLHQGVKRPCFASRSLELGELVAVCCGERRMDIHLSMQLRQSLLIMVQGRHKLGERQNLISLLPLKWTGGIS